MLSFRRLFRRRKPVQTPLEWATTDELITELSDRASNVLIVWQGERQNLSNKWTFAMAGNAVWLLGTIAVIRDRIKKDIDSTKDKK